ncbi:hemolysin III family protein [Virgibacillus sp. MSP4-1]|uniref:PAQR family membrane homeostasis protein TrhA n=1 Tax=Virgibacillus sp. MSP4-1 TaxID=2700081 RepID=UPI00039C85B1|nr:hemolysin III family protein [Virgibacillus sp. MSP4-1]QHS22090.1 hemolysin III family protein [Virgibacillus sp. MSP4-1]
MYTYTKKEELVNGITHAIGAILSLFALFYLILYAADSGSFWRIFSVSVYGLSMFFMYTSSTFVHLVPRGRLKELFLMLDHSSIFLFIAGSYTPITLLLLKGTIGWILFGSVWGIALFGMIFKMIFIRKYTILTTVLYILLGWFVVVAWEPLTSKMAYNGIVLLIAGGLCYSIGTIFYLWRGFPYHHAIWHIFVLLGSGFHFYSIFYYIVA